MSNDSKSYTVRLLGFPDVEHDIAATALSQAFSISIRKAGRFIEKAPIKVKSNLSPEDARRVTAVMLKLGADLEVLEEKSGLTSVLRSGEIQGKMQNDTFEEGEKDSSFGSRQLSASGDVFLEAVFSDEYSSVGENSEETVEAWITDEYWLEESLADIIELGDEESGVGSEPDDTPVERYKQERSSKASRENLDKKGDGGAPEYKEGAGSQWEELELLDEPQQKKVTNQKVEATQNCTSCDQLSKSARNRPCSHCGWNASRKLRFCNQCDAQMEPILNLTPELDGWLKSRKMIIVLFVLVHIGVATWGLSIYFFSLILGITFYAVLKFRYTEIGCSECLDNDERAIVLTDAERALIDGRRQVSFLCAGIFALGTILSGFLIFKGTPEQVDFDDFPLGVTLESHQIVHVMDDGTLITDLPQSLDKYRPVHHPVDWSVYGEISVDGYCISNSIDGRACEDEGEDDARSWYLHIPFNERLEAISLDERDQLQDDIAISTLRMLAIYATTSSEDQMGPLPRIQLELRGEQGWNGRGVVLTSPDGYVVLAYMRSSDSLFTVREGETFLDSLRWGQ
jgi:hypothetical protein